MSSGDRFVRIVSFVRHRSRSRRIQGERTSSKVNCTCSRSSWHLSVYAIQRAHCVPHRGALLPMRFEEFWASSCAVDFFAVIFRSAVVGLHLLWQGESSLTFSGNDRCLYRFPPWTGQAARDDCSPGTGDVATLPSWPRERSHALVVVLALVSPFAYLLLPMDCTSASGPHYVEYSLSRPHYTPERDAPVSPHIGQHLVLLEAARRPSLNQSQNR